MNRLLLFFNKLAITGLFLRLSRLYVTIIEPPASLQDPEERRYARMFNGLLVLIIPVVCMVLGVQLLIEPIRDTTTTTTIPAILIGIAIPALIYSLPRIIRVKVNPKAVSYTAIVIGMIAILFAASTSTPPHLEYIFLIFLPLVGTMFFSLWETFVLCVITFTCLIIFGLSSQTMPRGFFKDLLVFTTLTQTFILFVAQQRNRLETDRQQFAVEKARSTILQELLTNLSHDFRTPLTVINTNAQMLAYATDQPKRQERIERITDQTMRLNGILDDILYISNLETESLEKRELLDLHSLLREVMEECRPAATSKNITLLDDLAPMPIYITARHDHLRRLFLVLLDNALHYTPADGTVTLHTHLSDRIVVAEVRDTGIGIAEADLGQVFEPFFRADKARAMDEGGAGLGLSIARRIVEIYDGSIVTESQPDQGTTFRFRLPISNMTR